MPKEWNTAILCPIYKKGDPMLPENYRRIYLPHTRYKMLTTLIMELLNYYVTDIIGDYQCGFSKGKSTIDHIHTIR
jgi:REP element-mobilizing transposase RayT